MNGLLVNKLEFTGRQSGDDEVCAPQVKTTAVPMAIMAAVPLSVLVAAVLVLVYRAGYDQGQNSHVVRRRSSSCEATGETRESCKRLERGL